MSLNEVMYVTLLYDEQTYSVDYQTPDSAATATAMLCGEKTNNDVIAANQNTTLDDCASQIGNEIPSILTHALNAGKRTGVVTTARLTHASPAVTFAHAANRGWEADSDLPASAVGVCPDIASQFIDTEVNRGINVNTLQ